MSTFKTTNLNLLPAKPSEIKRRSNNRKQIYATLNSNNNNNSTIIIENENCSAPPPPPPPPPFPVTFDSSNKIEIQISSKNEPIKSPSDFQNQIEQAKTRLKKVDIETSSIKSIVKSNHQCKFKIDL